MTNAGFTFLPRNAVLLRVGAMSEDLGATAQDCATNMSRLLTFWRNRRYPIVHVQLGKNVSTQNSGVSTAACPGEKVINAAAADVFCGTRLRKLLRCEGLNYLLFIGDDSEHSITLSANTAGKFGFEAYVVADGIYEATSAPHTYNEAESYDLPAKRTEEIFMMAPPEVYACR